MMCLGLLVVSSYEKRGQRKEGREKRKERREKGEEKCV